MKVVIVDDDQLVVLSLKTILEANEEIAVVGTGSDGTEAVTLYEKEKPDILFLTTFSDDEYIVKALDLGAKGYILKQDFEGIVPALQAVERGQSVFGGEIVSRIPVLMQSKSEFDYASYEIGEKEQEIIALVGKGKSNREIADELFLSEGTVRNYISTILEKLSLRDRTQLAVFYLTKVC